jgi:hypothetical protein
VTGRLGIALAALALATAAGCGGGGDDPGGGGTAAADRFAADADAICIAGAKRDVAIQADQDGSDPAATAAFLARLQASRERVADELAALDAPDGDGEQLDALVASRRAAAEQIGAGAAAARDEDLAAYQAVRAKSRTVSDEGDALAAGIGLEACARRLPPAQRREILRLLDLTADPAAARELCTVRVSERFVADRFASVRECVEQQSGRTAADRAEVTDLSGTSEVFATAYIDLSGADGGQPVEYEAGLIHEDGRWKLHTLAETPPR